MCPAAAMRPESCRAVASLSQYYVSKMLGVEKCTITAIERAGCSRRMQQICLCLPPPPSLACLASVLQTASRDPSGRYPSDQIPVLTSSRLKKNCPAAGQLCQLRAAHSADHSKARATDGAARIGNDRCGWPRDACDEAALMAGQP